MWPSGHRLIPLDGFLLPGPPPQHGEVEGRKLSLSAAKEPELMMGSVGNELMNNPSELSACGSD